jgi:hypothetical protein
MRTLKKPKTKAINFGLVSTETDNYPEDCCFLFLAKQSIQYRRLRWTHICLLATLAYPSVLFVSYFIVNMEQAFNKTSNDTFLLCPLEFRVSRTCMSSHIFENLTEPSLYSPQFL